MPYTPDNTKPVLHNFSSILCIILLHETNDAVFFLHNFGNIFFHDTYINILCSFVQRIWHALTTCSVWETTHDCGYWAMFKPW